MKKDLTEILTDGFELWRNNLILGVPPLLSWIIQLVLGITIIVVMVFAVLGVGFGTGLFLEDFENIDAIIGSLGSIVIIVVLLILFVVIITLLIDAFFMAGLIGMVKEAIETGKTEFETMVEYGKRKFISLFLANLMVTIIILLPLIIIGIIFLILFAGSIGGVADYSGGAETVVYSFLLFFVVMILWMLYALIISIVLAVVNYAVVISDTGAIGGIKAAYRFFMNHMSDVILMWLIILGISIVCVIVYLAVEIPLSFIPLIGSIIGFLVEMIFYAFIAFVLTPLIALWWSWLYMDREQLLQTKTEPSKSPSKISG
ncbi:MAG: hypothetical protein A7316_06410 [Candidatus Altiarchaeales archaeon WOR_SM1_86-2]|nr:MAG: hypothetical protein A7316_06410 [Candidatus Altiarchaeales archaeon WOR_SM1_86-2]ODS39612.1 MAG: hypothetical protein A7315_10725 [Candidatus Altiarchaeales archaeon WOR_SM1_79]